ncbi:Haloacid Dehalogenase Superfamily Class (subfamily) IIA [Tessaracoccus bendigoensis DSM 12906]|uniref:Haloacid Dehalogenase Superfamily Class (Subfamily) IIA n=1 Tax=Tessaracoccus bendigoensis DSM 12906 TaxID=1123357 RepID=A0A1M6LIV6_9ACTN|nr:HAD-IIA family hydrolase [Tessaracoccus bendigoensis]SHJ71078.1 Haloacid Dehalogenase Superfamily Class (subfamily) IIA [Tessaracoccus bendigoensis DSM 12906]
MRALAEDYDASLFDLDGVIYLGPYAIDGVPEALEELRSRGTRLGFVTNNAARTPETVAEHLVDLGIEAAPSDVVNSTMATLRMLGDDLQTGARILAVGTDALRQQLVGAGFTLVDSLDDEPSAVVQGYSPTIAWPRLEEAALAVQRGAAWYATNPDLTRPSDRGIVPGLGTQIAVVRACVDVDPQIAGKPFRPLLDETVLRMEARHPIFVGDRTDTDVLGANTVGMDSLFVFTGAHGKHDLAEAEPAYRPTYIGYDASALLEPPRVASFGEQRYVCGYQEVDLTDKAAFLSTRPVTRDEQLDALWAALQAVWRFGLDISAVLNSLDTLR